MSNLCYSVDYLQGYRVGWVLRWDALSLVLVGSRQIDSAFNVFAWRKVLSTVAGTKLVAFQRIMCPTLTTGRVDFFSLGQ